MAEIRAWSREALGFDGALVEVADAVMHYVSFNTIAHGMRLEASMAGLTASDFVPGGCFAFKVLRACRAADG